MELKPNMYVRTKEGYICKILKLNEPFEDDGYLDHNDIGSSSIKQKNILKASHNIIDLIKHKDIILSKDGKIYQCWKVYKDYVFTYSKNKQGQTITLVDYQIDKVLCHEQFESMSYKVGD